MGGLPFHPKKVVLQEQGYKKKKMSLRFIDARDGFTLFSLLLFFFFFWNDKARAWGVCFMSLFVFKSCFLPVCVKKEY